MPSLSCKYQFGQRVHIDNDRSIVGVVTMIEWRSDNLPARYEVSWLANSDAKFIIFDEWRLTAADG